MNNKQEDDNLWFIAKHISALIHKKEDDAYQRSNKINRYSNYMWFIAGLVIGAFLAGAIMLAMVKHIFVDSIQ